MNNLQIIDNILMVKVGTSTLIPQKSIENGEINQENFNRIGKQLKQQQKLGKNVILVSSAAIAAGMIETGIKKRPSTDDKQNIPELQRLAAIGWRTITNAWNEAMDPIFTPDALITRRELGNKKERKELLKFTYGCLFNGDIPTFNENDAISHEEIVFGDNDILTANFAATIGRSSLFGSRIEVILLSDVDGIYQDPSDPKTIISIIDKLPFNPSMAHGSNYQNGTGGMISKIEAAAITRQNAIDLYITNGSNPSAIVQTIDGKTGTLIPAISKLTD